MTSRPKSVFDRNFNYTKLDVINSGDRCREFCREFKTGGTAKTIQEFIVRAAAKHYTHCYSIRDTRRIEEVAVVIVAVLWPQWQQR